MTTIIKPTAEAWPPAGTWRGARLTDQGNRRTATVGCPKCGKCASLSDHEIAADGSVSPSVICPHEGCDFHDCVRLEGWSA